MKTAINWADTIRRQLGDSWTHDGIGVVTNGVVTINVRINSIKWLDLAPHDEGRTERLLFFPSPMSVGAVVAVVQTLDAISRQS
jgi:hypothetical protein